MAKFEKPEMKPEEEKIVEHDAPESYEEMLKEPERPEGREEEEFEKALNNKDFLEFLAQYPDAAELSVEKGSRAEIERRLEAFENREELKSGLKDLYEKELGQELDVKLSKNDTPLFDGFLNEEAMKDPDGLRGRLENLRNYREIKKDNAELEGEIAKFGGGAAVEAEKKTLERQKAKAKGSIGWRRLVNPKNWELVQDLFRIQDKEFRREIRGKSKEERLQWFADADKQVKELRARKEFLERYPTMKEATEAVLANLRKEFLEKFEPAHEIFRAMTIKAVNKLDNLIGRPDKKATEAILEDAQTYLESLKKAHGKGLNFEELKNLPLGDFQNRIDAKMELEVIGSIRDIVQKFEVGNEPLSSLEKSLGGYLKKEKLGSKGKEMVRNFVAAKIKHEIEQLSEEKPPRHKEKTILLKFVLSKIMNY